MTNAVMLMPWGGDKDEDQGMYACHIYPGDAPVGNPICVIRYTDSTYGLNPEGKVSLFLYRKKKLIATFLEIFDRRLYRLFELEDGCISEVIGVGNCDNDSEDDDNIRYTDDDIKGE